MSGLIEEFYRAYYTFKFALDLYTIIQTSIENITKLTALVSDKLDTYKTESDKENLLKYMGFGNMIPPNEELLNDKISPTSSIYEDIERPFESTIYSKPFIVKTPEDEPSFSEVVALIRELYFTSEYVKKQAYIKMQQVIIAEADKKMPQGTENRIVNLVKSLKQYVRFI